MSPSSTEAEATRTHSETCVSGVGSAESPESHVRRPHSVLVCTCRHEHTRDRLSEVKTKAGAIGPFTQRGFSLGTGEKCSRSPRPDFLETWSLHLTGHPSRRVSGSAQSMPCGERRVEQARILLTHSHSSRTHPIHTHHTCSAHMRVHTGSHPHRFVHMSSRTHITHTHTHSHSHTYSYKHILTHAD